MTLFKIRPPKASSGGVLQRRIFKIFKIYKNNKFQINPKYKIQMTKATLKQKVGVDENRNSGTIETIRDFCGAGR
jgi:hypothetical protein